MNNVAVVVDQSPFMNISKNSNSLKNDSDKENKVDENVVEE